MVQKKGGTVLSAASLSINKVLDGMDSFLYIRFSEFPDGRNMSSEPNEKTKYIGVVSTKENRPPSDPARYAWTAFKGADGEKTFLWVRYSEQDGGKPKMESNPSAKTQYMGVYSGPETTAPTDATRYRWVKTKGEQGESSYLHVRYSDYADGTGFYEKPKRTTMFIGVAVTVSEKAPVNKEAYDWAEFGVNIEFGGRNYILESLAPVVVKKQGSRKWISAYPSSRFSKDWPGYTGFAVVAIHGYTSGTAYPENVRMRLVGLKGTSRVYEEEFVIPQSELKKKEFEHSHVFIIPEPASTANSYLLEVYGWTENMELEIDKIKLERGNRPTDWSGAPEDVSSEMMEIKKESASLGVLIQKLESGKASTAELQALATELSGYVKSNTSYGGVKITDQGVLLDSTNMEVVLDQRNGFLIKTKKPGQTILQVDKDGKFIINASNLNTEIEDTKKEIDKKIDEIEIGATNLISIASGIESYGSYNSQWEAKNQGRELTSIYKRSDSGFLTLGVKGMTPQNGFYTASGRLSVNGRPLTKDDFEILRMNTYNSDDRGRIFYISQNGFFRLTERYLGESRWIFHMKLKNLKEGDEVVVEDLKFEKGVKATDWSPAPEDTTQEIIDGIDGLDFGGTNLLKNSKTKLKSNGYLISTLYFGETKPKDGETYTISIKGEMGNDVTHFPIYNSGGTLQVVSLAERDKNSKGVYTKTFKWKDYGSNTHINIYNWPRASTGTSEIEWVKIESGNKATDWSPAPEDVEQQIEDIEIGGRNLFIGSQDYSGDLWTNMSNWTRQSEKFKQFTVMKRVGQWMGISQDIDAIQGQSYTLSAFMKADGNGISFYGNHGSNTVSKNNTLIDVSSEWKRVSITFTAEKDGIIRPRFESKEAGVTTWICGQKLEVGHKATDWTPAPEDVTNEISDIEIGGRNLLIDTNYEIEPKAWNNSEVKVIDDSPNRYIKVTKTGSSSSFGAVSNDSYNFLHNERYTLSFEIRTKDVTAINYIYVISPTGNVLLKGFSDDNPIITDGQWHKYTYTFKTWFNRSNSSILVGATNNGTAFDLRRTKLERGSKSTDWTPAPEDARVYKAWANSIDGKKDFTRVEPRENLLSDEEGKVYTRDGKDRGEFINDPQWDLLGIVDSHGLDKDYAISFDLKTTKAGRVNIYMQNGSGSPYEFTAGSGISVQATTSWNRYSISVRFKKNEKNTDQRALLAFFGQYGTGVFPHVRNIKVEVGKEATMFVPSKEQAPERAVFQFEGLSATDSDNPDDYNWGTSQKYLEIINEVNLGGKVDSNEYENDREEIQTSLGDKASKDELKEIEDLANQIQDEYEEFIKDGGRYEADLESLEKRISAMVLNLGDKIAEFNFINKYIKLGEEGLLLGDSTSLMNILISDKRISFFDGGKEVAYMEGQEFRINRGTILESLQVGSHKMEQVDANSTIFTFIS